MSQPIKPLRWMHLIHESREIPREVRATAWSLALLLGTRTGWREVSLAEITAGADTQPDSPDNGDRGYRTTQRHLALLRSKGWLDMRPVHRNGRRTGNAYLLLDPSQHDTGVAYEPSTNMTPVSPRTFKQHDTGHAPQGDTHVVAYYVVNTQGESDTGAPNADVGDGPTTETQTAPVPPALRADEPNAETETAWLDAAESASRDARYWPRYNAELAEGVRLNRQGKGGDKHERARATALAQLAEIKQRQARTLRLVEEEPA